MTTAVETATGIRPFHVDFTGRQIDELRRRIVAARLPHKELVDDRSQGVQLATIEALQALLGERVRLPARRAAAERAAAVHDRDRRPRHPLRPRALAARGCAAADRHPRLARLGDRAARYRRAADRPDRPWRNGRGCVPPRDPVAAWLRLLGRAGRARLVHRPHCAGVGGADAPPRLRPLRRPGRRPGSSRHRRHGPPGTRGADRRSPEPAQERAGKHKRPPCTVRRGTCGSRRRHHIQDERLRLLPGAVHTAADDRLRAARLTRSPWRRGCSTTTRTATTRSPTPSSTANPPAISRATRPRQRHAVLADRHGCLRGPVVLGGRTGPRRLPPARRLRQSRSRSASPPSPARSSARRAAG